jgi:hypothetical protein
MASHFKLSWAFLGSYGPQSGIQLVKENGEEVFGAYADETAEFLNYIEDWKDSAEEKPGFDIEPFDFDEKEIAWSCIRDMLYAAFMAYGSGRCASVHGMWGKTPYFASFIPDRFHSAGYNPEMKGTYTVLTPMEQKTCEDLYTCIKEVFTRPDRGSHEWAPPEGLSEHEF